MKKQKKRFSWKSASKTERTKFTIATIKKADERRLFRIGASITMAMVGKRGYGKIMAAIGDRGDKLGL